MALLLSCENLSRSFGARTLFRGISLSISDGEKVGMIGPNGSGKSTLLKILAGLDHPDEGELTSKRQLQLAYVAQEDVFAPAVTVEQALVAALAHNHMDDHDRHTQAAILLGRLDFPDPDKLVSQLSGGWKKRLSIARALITGPELLLLDEPTNHLDLEGILWLEKLLVDAPFAFLMITHDRYILENAANRVTELSRIYPDGFLSISGPYSEFVQRQAEFMEGQQSQQQALAGKVRRELAWLHRGAKARTTKAKGRIQDAKGMIQDLAEIQVRNNQSGTMQVDFAATGRQTRKLIALQQVGKALGGRGLFSDLDVVLAPGTKLGIVGPNGSGKTTLLRLLAGELEPDSGQIRRADGLRIVLFHQDRSTLNKDETLRKALGAIGDTVIYHDQPLHVTSWAKKFLFRTEQLDQPVALLSGGEQSRVLIARMMLESADVLILDEPTNDLDIPSLEVLEESMDEFPGALVLVTHDRFMIGRLCSQILGLDGRGGWGMYADFAQWESAWRRARRKPATAAEPPKAEAARPVPGIKSPAIKSSATKKLSWKEQRELEQIEASVLAAEEDVARLEKESADPQIMADHRKAHERYAQLSKAQRLVHTLYARWQELEAQKG